MDIVPLYDKILVQLDATEEKTKGGIYTPINAVKEQLLAHVIAVGEGRLLSSGKTIPSRVDLGDTVILGKFSGTAVKHEGENYLLIREDDILAIVKN